MERLVLARLVMNDGTVLCLPTAKMMEGDVVDEQHDPCIIHGD